MGLIGHVWINQTLETKVHALREYAQKCANLHMWVANQPNSEISFYQFEIYRTSQTALKAAIKAAYPNLDTERIYEIWVDCGESVKYCADFVRDNVMV